MKTLFLRIFLAFWASTLLVLAMTAAFANYRFAQMQRVRIDIKQLADEAADAVINGGVRVLPEWIQESQRKYSGRRIFVIDASGRDVLGRALPPPMEYYVDKLRAAGFLGKELTESRRDDPLLLTPLFAAPSGEVFTVMISNPQWPWKTLEEPDVRVVLMLVALVVSGVVCWWLARYVSRPVERLQLSARSLAMGNLEARVGEEFSRRHDELGVLARDFDRMADHVRASIDSREDLIRGLSHELRSPLARMRVALGLARRAGADITKQLDRIELETERLDTLIGQMLQLSQLRTAEPHARSEAVDIGTLLAEIVDDARLEASATDKRVEYEGPASAIVNGDYVLLRSAIENVLRNAVRFTAVGTAVQVWMAAENERLRITVRDRGPGVPPAELERIFEPFYRVAESRDRDTGGTGIGLAITARVVGLYGGRVRARNIAEGGLEVEIEWPRQAPQTAGELALPADGGSPASPPVLSS